MRKVAWKKAYAYAVGLNKYEHLRTLSYCEKDANVFIETISQVIPNIKTELLGGTNFTIEKFKKLLNEIEAIDEKEEHSILFFYYAGHGFSREGKDYLTSYDTNDNSMETMENTSISTTDLIDIANKSRINTIVMIFDACRSFSSRSVATDSFGDLTAEISRRRGIISFFSCSPGENSHELSGEISHGVYTYSLVQAIKDCSYCTPVEINKSVVGKVQKLVKENNLPEQKPYTTVGPIEKANLDIIHGSEVSYTNERKPTCILIAGSTHAGKSGIGRYLATKYNFGHYEMSALAYKRYEDFKNKNSVYETISDFLEYELCAKNEHKDILARDLLEKYDGRSNVVISGPRFVEEVETLMSNSNWNIIPLYIYSASKIRLERFIALQKDQSLTAELAEITYENFLRKDMRELGWGLAKIATMTNFKMVINNDEIDVLYNKVKTHMESVIIRLHLDLAKQ